MMLWYDGPWFHERKIWQKIEMEGGSNLELKASEGDTVSTPPGLFACQRWPDGPQYRVNAQDTKKSTLDGR